MTDTQTHTPAKIQCSQTPHSDRINLFDLTENNEFHIGTLVSGSKEKIQRFRQTAHFMAASPDMAEALELIVASNDHLTDDGVRREYQHNMYRGIIKARAALAKAKGG